MELIKPGTNYDFLGKSRTVITLSLVLIFAVLALLPFRLNYGVDFAGGTEIEVAFNEAVSAKEVREKIEAAGFAGAGVQQIGDASENAYIVRVERVSILSAEQVEALRETMNQQLTGYGAITVDVDENVGDRIDVRSEQPIPLAELERAASAAGIELAQVGERVRDLTRAGEPTYQLLTQSLSDRVTSTLINAFGADEIDVRRVDYVGPQVGQQLRNRGIMSMLLAMGAVLLYIAFRFDIRFAPGAVLALVHDVAIVLGYWVVTGREFNLTSIAVLLTVIGYSVNDTIVVFDRVREILARKNGKTLAENINTAVNESLSRTVITSGSTGLAMVGLLIFTSGSLFDFAAAMLVGVVAATYSSIYIAGPVAIWVDKKLQESEARKKAAGGHKAKRSAAAHAD